MSKRNLILAGVARSGSTLACHLLNKVDNSVALHEPILPNDLNKKEGDSAIEFVDFFFAQEREAILHHGVATSKSHQGKVPDNPLADVDPKTGKRKRQLDGKQITIDKPLTDDFYLTIKQPGLFTGMLGTLIQEFDCFATIRNPLGVLQSWNTVDMPVSNGRAPAAEACDSLLTKLLDNEPDKYQRQLILLSWYFEQFSLYLSSDQIIRYENVIRSGGAALRVIVPQAAELKEPLKSKNDNAIYKKELKQHLSKELLNSKGHYWDFYSKADVLALL